MDDKTLADTIRERAQALRQAVVEARAAGLSVSVPGMLSHWVDTGIAPGEPAHWTITRSTL